MTGKAASSKFVKTALLALDLVASAAVEALVGSVGVSQAVTEDAVASEEAMDAVATAEALAVAVGSVAEALEGTVLEPRQRLPPSVPILSLTLRPRERSRVLPSTCEM